MFDSLVDFLKTNIDELNGHEVQISSEFKEHHNEDSKYIIKNWLFSSPEYRKWRITRSVSYTHLTLPTINWV